MFLDRMICLSFAAVILLLAVAVGIKTIRDRRISREWYNIFGEDPEERKKINGEAELKDDGNG